MGRLQDT